MFGWFGRILRVDLTHETTSAEEVDPQIAKDYIGGREWVIDYLDTLPRRMLEETLPDGPGRGHIVELDRMLPEFYRLRGWDENGLPTPDKLRSLGLDWVCAFDQGDPSPWIPRLDKLCDTGVSAFGLQRLKSYGKLSRRF
jgi:aldehyde:ferredoxin oxidoreductase